MDPALSGVSAFAYLCQETLTGEINRQRSTLFINYPEYKPLSQSFGCPEIYESKRIHISLKGISEAAFSQVSINNSRKTFYPAHEGVIVALDVAKDSEQDIEVIAVRYQTGDLKADKISYQRFKPEQLPEMIEVDFLKASDTQEYRIYYEPQAGQQYLSISVSITTDLNSIRVNQAKDEFVNQSISYGAVTGFKYQILASSLLEGNIENTVLMTLAEPQTTKILFSDTLGIGSMYQQRDQLGFFWTPYPQVQSYELSLGQLDNAKERRMKVAFSDLSYISTSSNYLNYTLPTFSGLANWNSDWNIDKNSDIFWRIEAKTIPHPNLILSTARYGRFETSR
ncbi:MAG: hypothetical protein R2880_17630 [Deinococcales bacterium]